ncbi:hypothetical protein HanPI659440_Chr00c11g0723941 [Helianthus annuus]|nr:hypothetical protein HanPI659440_Chr00c11g0723941 [Helianthus annuus]
MILISIYISCMYRCVRGGGTAQTAARGWEDDGKEGRNGWRSGVGGGPSKSDPHTEER